MMLYDLIFIIIIVPSSQVYIPWEISHAFSHDTSQVDLRLIGPHVAWLPACAAAVVPTVPQGNPTKRRAPL